MKSCTRKILFIIGLFSILIILFIPYKSVHIKYKLDPHSLANYKITTHQSGYLFVFTYLKLKSSEISDPGTDQDFYSLNKPLFLIEIIILIVLAPLDYVLFCIILKKRKL